MRSSKLTGALGCVLLAGMACRPLDNPYQYYGEACGSDGDCGGALVCVEGTCQGKSCEADADCDHELLRCVAGTCELGEPGKDAARDQGGSDGCADCDAGDQDVSHPDSARPDYAGMDTTGMDLAPPRDAGGQDSAGRDLVGTDTTLADRVEPDAGQCNPFDVPSQCNANSDCHSELMSCADNQCVPAAGQPYELCLVGDQSWCSPGLVCASPWMADVGFCAVQCFKQTDCPSDHRCVSLGAQGDAVRGGEGVCLATCTASLQQEIEARRFSASFPLACSTEWGSTGLLIGVPADLLSMPCGGSDGGQCGGPMVCVTKPGGSPQGRCMLLPEALMWQAESKAVIGTGGSLTCPQGLISGKASEDGTSLRDVCLPRCREDGDCSLALPAGWRPYCHKPRGEDAAGYCSTMADTNGLCWLDGFSASPNQPCKPSSDRIDSDGDGILDTMELQCSPPIFDVTGGCGGKGMCRSNSECPMQASQPTWCVAGVCTANKPYCRPEPGDCLSAWRELWDVPMCPNGPLCVPPQIETERFETWRLMCVEDSDCPNEAGESWRCVGNACHPPGDVTACSDGEAYHGVCLPEGGVADGLFGCRQAVDCPRGMGCGDGLCRGQERFVPECQQQDQCGNGNICAGAVCMGPGPGSGCEGDTGVRVNNITYCVDCALFADPYGPWTAPIKADSGTPCPCGMQRDGDVCYGPRSLCRGDVNGQCQAEHQCVAGRCLRKLAEGQVDCPLGHERMADGCASCYDTGAAPGVWALPCFSCGGFECPCGLECTPEPGGLGVCAPPLPDSECPTLPDYTWCGEASYALGGRCQQLRSMLESGAMPCDSQNLCPDGGECLSLGGHNFCASAALAPCDSPGGSCVLAANSQAPLAGTCVGRVGTGTQGVCLPNEALPRLSVLGWADPRLCQNRSAWDSCGPDCACVPDPTGTGGLVALSFTPTALGPSSLGFGDRSFDPGDYPPAGAGLVEGQLCPAGQHPGRVHMIGGARRCVPTGQPPAPGCGFGDTVHCLGDQICQVDSCLGACTDDNSCGADARCVQPLGAVHKICRRAPQIPNDGCPRYSGRCTYGGVVEGGVCLPKSGPDREDQCFPRVGCDLVAPGEACVDGAPVPVEVLLERECRPWGETRCAFRRGACAVGQCRLNDVGAGVCSAPTECNHWLECRPGSVCLGGRCVEYRAMPSGGQCPAGPYAGGGEAAAVFGGRCHLEGDPRCFGRGRGQRCHQPAEPGEEGSWTDHVCTTSGTCVSLWDLGYCDTGDRSACPGGQCFPVGDEANPGAGRCIP